MANTRLWTTDKDTPFKLAGRLVDPARLEIVFEGETVVVEPRVMALLLQLCETPNQPVRRDALIEAVWPGSPGAESSLSNAISLLRQALSDQTGNAALRLIKTVPKIGYCLKAVPSLAEEPKTGKRFARVIMFGSLAVILGGALLLRMMTTADDNIEPSTEERLFVVVAPIAADDPFRPLAHALARDAVTLLEAGAAYRVADQSEAYRVSAGELEADLVIATTIEKSETGIRLRARWSSGDARLDAVREIDVAPGAVLALRDQWLEAIAVETALVLQPGTTDSLASQQDTEDAEISLPPTTNSAEAFEAYLNGLYLASQYRPDLMLEAINNFERATRLDDKFAMAWAQLGASLMQAGSHQGTLASGATRARARDALLKAVTLQPGLALAHDSLGDYYNCIAREPLLAQRAFDQLFDISPEFASPAYTRLLLLHYSADEAIAQIEKNIVRYPDSLTWRLIAAQHLLAAGQIERALTLAEQALQMAPDFTETRLTVAKIRSTVGRHDEALSMLEALYRQSPTSTRIAAHYTIALARAERLQEAVALRDRMLGAASQAKSTHRSIAYAWTGEADLAFAALDDALEEREFGLCYISKEPIYAPLRDDPRFDEIVQAMRGADIS
ncbi:MAG: winged helix-turn-helix domain-containing protein [Pseudomonadota bacterium]